AVGGDLVWDRESVTLDFSVVLAEKSGGIARALNAPPTPSQTLGLFPRDFLAVGRIAFPSAAGLVNAAYGVLDRIDPGIGAEYRDELADFKKETGVDFEGDLLANVIGEVGFGARVDFAKPNPIAWAVACPLADTPRFFAQLDALLKHFDVPVTREAGNDVRQSVLKIPFAFGPSCGCLVIADSPTTIAEMKPMADVHRPRRAALDACLGHLFDPNLSCLLVDLRA